MSSVYERDYVDACPQLREAGERSGRRPSSTRTSRGLEREMRAAAANLDFERAAALRDDIKALRSARAGSGGRPAERLTACRS